MPRKFCRRLAAARLDLPKLIGVQQGPSASLTRRALYVIGILLAPGVGLTFLPAAAHADPVELGACNTSALTQPFLRWVDPAWYELAPGGDFENATWALSGGAQVVSGSEPWGVSGSVGSHALALPAGASADSPVTCVDAAYPTIRFFIAGAGTVAVGLVDDGTYIPAGIAIAGGGWQPALVTVTDSALDGLLSGGTANVDVRITALSGDPQVDDVFIDPWNRG